MHEVRTFAQFSIYFLFTFLELINNHYVSEISLENPWDSIKIVLSDGEVFYIVPCLSPIRSFLTREGLRLIYAIFVGFLLMCKGYHSKKKSKRICTDAGVVKSYAFLISQ
jgi:hypothetical protein